MPWRAGVWVGLIWLMASQGGGLFGQSASFESPPIDYHRTKVSDPVAELADRLQAGEIELAFDSRQGYLPAVLEALAISPSSQVLVFSKTSLQVHRISPYRPRAIYFNDDVYVGWCQGGDVLELAATDRNQGAIFYTLSQSSARSAALVRDRGQCLTCHASSRTQDVPGYLVRSVYPDPTGQPHYGSGTKTTDHTSPFEERWGGWYVTGSHGNLSHLGNVVFESMEKEQAGSGNQVGAAVGLVERGTGKGRSGVNRLSLDDLFNISPYLSTGSDLVALMVLEHQTQTHNAITRANYVARETLAQTLEMNRILDRPDDFLSESALRRLDAAATNLTEHLLMAGEFPLTSPVTGSSSFTEEFQKAGVQDSRGRSLKDLDLQTRLFRYPCSYLIYSEAFKALPDAMRTRVLSQVRTIVDEGDPSERYAHLTPELRASLREILIETHPELARMWGQESKTVSDPTGSRDRRPEGGE